MRTTSYVANSSGICVKNAMTLPVTPLKNSSPATSPGQHLHPGHLTRKALWLSPSQCLDQRHTKSAVP